MRYRLLVLSVSLPPFVVLVGCGESNSNHDSKASPRQPTSNDGGDAAAGACAGMPLLGLKYSPGGDVLPHPCDPFDPVTNNPYAIRCIDAMPDFKTPYPGDEFCILPPPPDQGIQIGVHPQGSDYWARMSAGDYSGYADAARTEPFEVKPGSEVNQTYDDIASNAESHDYFRLDSRMRPGSHHLVSFFNELPDAVRGWEPVSGDAFSRIAASPGLYNVQSTHSDRPAALSVAPEDEGLGATFPAKPVISFQVHLINTDVEPLLREVWLNIWWLPGDRKAAAPVTPGVSLANVDYPPNQLIDNVGSYAPTADTRIVSIFGHRHAWTTRFSAELVRASGETTEMYDSFNWLEMPTYQLDSLTQNPPADVAAQRDGALSGLTILHPGDQIKYHCYVDTTQRQADALHVPVPSANLMFANEAIGAEMCVLYLEIAPMTMTQ